MHNLNNQFISISNQLKELEVDLLLAASLIPEGQQVAGRSHIVVAAAKLRELNKHQFNQSDLDINSIAVGCKFAQQVLDTL